MTRTLAEKQISEKLFCMGEMAVSAIQEVLTSADSSPALKIKCAEIILDRICGKTVDSLDIEGKDFSPETVSEYLLERKKELKGAKK